VERLVKSVMSFRRRSHLRVTGGALPQHGLDRIARDGVCERKRADADQDQDQDRLDKAATDVNPDPQCQPPQAATIGRIGIDNRRGGQVADRPPQYDF
jgi:hypothetical protein